MSPPISPYEEGGNTIEQSPLSHRDSLDLESRPVLQDDGDENNTIEGNEKEDPKNENELDVYDNTLLRRIARIPLLPGLRFNLGMGAHLGTSLSVLLHLSSHFTI